jgi:flagellar motor switch protein FliN/FliY
MDASEVSAIAVAELAGNIDTPVLLTQLDCSAALEGQFFLFINGDGLTNVFDLAIPENAKEVGADDETILEGLREITSAAVSEAFENFAASMGHDIKCSVSDVLVLQDESGFEPVSSLYPEGSLLKVSTTLSLSGSSAAAGYLLPLSLSNQIIELLLNEQTPAVSEVSSIEPQDDESVDEATGPSLSASELSQVLNSMEDDSQDVPIQTPPNLQPATFGSLGDVSGGGDSSSSNISLLLDVMLDASIELGKTTMAIEEILKLTKGSVIELDKLASEPVEFLVNGKVIARGEVVVIDDNFGIRITEILSPRARLESL